MKIGIVIAIERELKAFLSSNYDIEEIVDIKVSYSLDVRVKEEIKEVVPTSRENSIKPRGKITLRKVKKIIKDKH